MPDSLIKGKQRDGKLIIAARHGKARTAGGGAQDKRLICFNKTFQKGLFLPGTHNFPLCSRHNGSLLSVGWDTLILTERCVKLV